MYIECLHLYRYFHFAFLNEINELLKLVGISAKAQQYIGYLSTGEKQLVMIARALIAKF